MIVHYIRDVNRDPIATVVAVGPAKVGVSICSTKDRFIKREGRNLAANRAYNGEQCKIPNQYFLDEVGDTSSVLEAVNSAIDHVTEKSYHYDFNRCNISNEAKNNKGFMFLMRTIFSFKK